MRRIDLERLIERLHRLLEILLFGQIAALPVKRLASCVVCGGGQLVAALRWRRFWWRVSAPTAVLPRRAALGRTGGAEATTREPVRQLAGAATGALGRRGRELEQRAGAGGAGAVAAATTTGAGSAGAGGLGVGQLGIDHFLRALNKSAASAGFWPISMARLISSMAGCGAPVAR